jgi:hypothetical protein
LFLARPLFHFSSAAIPSGSENLLQKSLLAKIAPGKIRSHRICQSIPLQNEHAMNGQWRCWAGPAIRSTEKAHIDQ